MFHSGLEAMLEQITSNIVGGASILDVIIYSIGMVVYSIFIYHFYRFIARREIITVRLDKYMSAGRKTLNISSYITKYMIIFPFLIFLWFMVYSFFMFFVAKDLPLQTVFLVAISLVVATRIASYYNEDLARDMGKLIPFALLGIFLASPTFYSTDLLQERMTQFVPFTADIVKFVGFAYVVEIVLRIIHAIRIKIVGVKEKPPE